MFQVEPVLWLQSFASPVTVWLMAGVTWLGTVPCLAAVVFFLVFAVRFRVGLAVLVVLCANSLATDLAKDAFALPRPGDVDTRVRQFGGDAAHPVAERGGAARFLALLPEPTVAAARDAGGLSWGFPSGHLTFAAALTLSIALLLRSRAGFWLVAAWLPLTGLSRMFLGRHWLADVLGGVALGGLVALAGFLLFGAEALGLERGRAAAWRRKGLLALAFGAMLLAVLVPGLDVGTAGRLAVACTLLYLAPALAFSEPVGPIFQAARTAIGVTLYFIVSPALAAAFDAAGLAGTARGAMLQGALTVLLVFGGGAVLARFVPMSPGARVARRPVGEA